MTEKMVAIPDMIASTANNLKTATEKVDDSAAGVEVALKMLAAA